MKIAMAALATSTGDVIKLRNTKTATAKRNPVFILSSDVGLMKLFQDNRVACMYRFGIRWKRIKMGQIQKSKIFYFFFGKSVPSGIR